jgi:hypothetical protein
MPALPIGTAGPGPRTGARPRPGPRRPGRARPSARRYRARPAMVNSSRLVTRIRTSSAVGSGLAHSSAVAPRARRSEGSSRPVHNWLVRTPPRPRAARFPAVRNRRGSGASGGSFPVTLRHVRGDGSSGAAHRRPMTASPADRHARQSPGIGTPQPPGRGQSRAVERPRPGGKVVSGPGWREVATKRVRIRPGRAGVVGGYGRRDAEGVRECAARPPAVPRRVPKARYVS